MFRTSKRRATGASAPKSLALRRQTVRALTPGELVRVRGAVPPTMLVLAAAAKT